MISALTSSALTPLSNPMIRGRKSDHALSAPRSFRLYSLKMLAVALLKRSYGVLKSARMKTGIDIGAANDPPIAVRIGREIEGIDRTAVSERAQHVTVEVPSLMLMKRIVVRLLPNARRTIVSPAWPKHCCLTGALRKRIASATFGNVTATESVIESVTVIVIVNVRGPESGTASETAIESENGTAIARGTVRGSGTATGTGNTARDHDAMMMLQVTMTEREEIVKRSERDSIAVALNAALSKNFPMGMNALLRPVVAELRMTRIAVIPEIRR